MKRAPPRIGAVVAVYSSLNLPTARPPTPQVARAILKRLSRVYGHIYHSHFRQVAALGLEPHLATCFRHFVLFVREFDLVDEAEMAPVRELMERIAR